MGINVDISRDYGKTVETLSNIPYASGCSYLRSGCLVIVNTTTVFVAGGLTPGQCGQKNKRDTYFYNMEKDTWTRGPYLRIGKFEHTCKLVTHDDGTRDVVIMGGYTWPQSFSGSCQFSNEVEII